MEDTTQPDIDGIALCAHCFSDRGLRLMALNFEGHKVACSNCGQTSPHGLNRGQLLALSDAFFVRGSAIATDYGGAPRIQFNEHQTGSLEPDPTLTQDVELLQRTLGIGFFHYGPRLWMLGHIEPLDDLRSEEKRDATIDRILAEYPAVQLSTEEFHRVRKAPAKPADHLEYDAPPEGCYGTGRLDAPGRPVLYASQDAEICVHESRFMAADELYIATLRSAGNLKLLDLSVILKEDKTEFESLDLAVLMVFLAQSHSYPVSRRIAEAVQAAGFDGLIYPSYFSILRTGGNPFETVYGLSTRRFGQAEQYERSKIIGNLALFGRPIASGKVQVVGMNRLSIEQVRYKMIFGPVTY
ncbi:MAG TPA: RES family NAD+ phosphorylase [Sphingomicrobium sp.]|nr:RES family NAD+ phosphorylase [Sphingomicrobium sp.]